MPVSSSRPIIVSLSVILLYLQCVASVWVWQDMTTLLVGITLLALPLLFFHFCALGHNWARIVLTIFAVIFLLNFGVFVFRLMSAIKQRGSAGFEYDISDIITITLTAICIVAPIMLFLGRSNAWFREVKARTVDRPSWIGVTVVTAGVFLSMAVSAGVRHHQWAKYTLPPEIITDVRNQLTGIHAKIAELDKMEAELTVNPVNDNSSQRRQQILMYRTMFREGGTTIFSDVHKRYPQLTKRQLFELASIIGNSLQQNAQYYLAFPNGVPKEGAIIENPSFDINDTSSNLPDPEP